MLFLRVVCLVVRFQPIESTLPVRSLDVDPGIHVVQCGRLDPNRADTPPLARADEADALEHLQVLKEGGQSHVERFAQCRHGRGTTAQAFDDRPSGRVCQCLEEAVDVACIVSHETNYRSPIRLGQRLPVLKRAAGTDRWFRFDALRGVPAEALELLLHAVPGALVTEDVVGYLRLRVSGLDIVCVGAGTHFIQEDQPQRIGRALAEWLARLPHPAGA